MVLFFPNHIKMLNNKKRRWELIFSISLLVLCVSVQAQKRPPNYSQDDMPITSFSCHNRIVGGYYADPETDCQMFHVCVSVPGVGIQDFRFLCPNDTTFDQEHQICDDWYNIDCELAQYDSFDLYRIGVDNEIKKPLVPKKPVIPNKGTPIPLGPSSTVKPLNVAAPKKNIYASVNNGISDDDFYTKSGNAVSDESKVPQDILRGSHSSNFYDSKTRGREDLENDYVAPNVGAKKQELSQPSDVKKHKTLVRKLASKRPVSRNNNQQNNNNVNYNNVNYNNVNYNTAQNVQRTQQNQTEFASTAIPQQKNRGNVNYNTFTKQQQQDFQDFQRLPATGGPTLYQKINNLTEENNYQDKKQDSNRNYDSTYNTRSQSKFRPSSKFTTTTAAPITTAEIRLPSTEYLQNIANNFQQPATLINNQLQDSAEYRKPVEYQGYNNQAYDYTFQQFKQPTTVNQAPTTKYPTVASQKYYETSSALPEQRKTTEFQSFHYQPNTTVFDYFKYYQTSTVSYQQKAKNYYSTTTTTPKYDPYATFQKSNEKYDEEEFLKTAPSSNLKPSDLNTIYNQKKNAYINATLKAAYNIEPHKASYYQAIATSPSPAPRVNYYQTSTPSTKNYYQTSTTTQNTHQAISNAAQNYQQPAANLAQQNYYQTFTTAAPQANYYQSAATNAPQNNYFSSGVTNPPAPQNYYQSVATSTQQNYYRTDATANTQQNNFYQSPATNVPQNNFYSSAAPSSPQNVNYQPAATNPPQHYYQTVTTKVPQKPNYQPTVTNPTPSKQTALPVKQTAFTAGSTSKQLPTNNQTKKPGDEKSAHDYDYAYYDNGGGSSEYDSIDTVGEEFARIQKHNKQKP